MSEIFTAAEAAKYLKVSRTEIYRYLNSGAWPFAIKLPGSDRRGRKSEDGSGGMWRIYRCDLDTWLQQHQVCSQTM